MRGPRFLALLGPSADVTEAVRRLPAAQTPGDRFDSQHGIIASQGCETAAYGAWRIWVAGKVYRPTHPESEAAPTAQRLAEEWARDPAGWLSRINGECTILILNQGSGALVVVRDPSGCVPAFYRPLGGAWVIATHASDLIPPGETPDWDPRLLQVQQKTGIAHPIRLARRPLRRVRPGFVEEFHPTGRHEGRRYWDPFSYQANYWSTPEQGAKALRQALEDAISDRVQGESRVATSLSGGQDSGGITALLRFIEGPSLDLSAINIQFAQTPAADERERAQRLAEHVSARFEVVPDDDLDMAACFWRIAPFLAEPPIVVNLVFNDAVYQRAAQVGAGVVLEGHWGDHVSGQGQGSTLDALWHLDRTTLREHLAIEGSWPRFLRNRILSPAWQTVRTALRQHAGRVRLSDQFLLALGMRHWYGGRAMEEVAPLAQVHGVRASFPFYDRRVMEAVLRQVSPRNRRRNGVGRWTYREALKDVFPEWFLREYRKTRLGPGFVRLCAGTTMPLRRRQGDFNELAEEWRRASRQWFLECTRPETEDISTRTLSNELR